MLDRLLREPTLLVEAVRQGILWALVMGFLSLTPEQHDQTIALASIVLALVNRALVAPSRG